MEGVFEGKFEEGLAVTVIDNCDYEHLVVMDDEGEILGHEADDYADNPSERTNTEDESFSQARRYARYTVYLETEYDTLPSRQNPDRLAATIIAIQNLSVEAFEEIFDPYYRQVISHYEPVDAPIPDLRYLENRDDFRVYFVELSLAQGLDEIKATGETYVDDLRTIANDVASESTLAGGLRSKLSTFGGKFGSRMQEADIELPGFSIDAVSDVQMLYNEADERRLVEGENSLEDPDARLELSPAPVESTAQFRALLIEHLLCQIRDCYVGMGVEPPAPFRVIGPGFHRYAQKYRHFEMYPDYVDPNANIPGYRV